MDVLNQRQHLEKWSRFPDAPKEKEELSQALTATLGAVEEVRRAFDTWARAYETGVLSALEGCVSRCSEEEKAAILSRCKLTLGCQKFSDTTILFAPLRKPGTDLCVFAVEAVLEACAAAMIWSLAHGIAIRGGVEVGMGTEYFPGEIYGSLLHSAYYLEREVAQYPRIVIGPGVVEFLERWRSNNSQDFGDQWNRNRAAECWKKTITDSDGHTILHYLGNGIHTFDAPDSGWRNIIGSAYTFVIEEHARFQKEPECEKLAGRYAQLRHYFDKWARPPEKK